jgi:hypothetical protein
MRRHPRPVTVGDSRLLTGGRPAFGADLPSTPEERVLAGVLPADLEQAVQRLDERFRTTLTLLG